MVLRFNAFLNLSHLQLVSQIPGVSLLSPTCPTVGTLSILFPFKAAFDMKKKKKKLQWQTLLRSNSVSHIAFGFHGPLDSSSLYRFLVISLSFTTLTLSKSGGQLFYRFTLSLDLPDVFLRLGWGFEVSDREPQK